jgi:hypothetical protein
MDKIRGKTRGKIKTINNKTRKKQSYSPKPNPNPSLKTLHIGYPLYASKKYKKYELLNYQRNAENKSGDHCILDNSSWFGNLTVAKSYKRNDTQIYKWKITCPTNLLQINKENESFIHDIFTNTTTPNKLTPTIFLSENKLKKIKYEHPYLKMSSNEKALYEFNFAFGYITIEEQYDFLKLIKYLIDNGFITLYGYSLLTRINLKINYYKIASLLNKKHKYNRLSIYSFDKHAIMNLCKIVYNKHYNNKKISGVYQKNNKSFWIPDLIVYKMNIEEYILFNPSHNLI